MLYRNTKYMSVREMKQYGHDLIDEYMNRTYCSKAHVYKILSRKMKLPEARVHFSVMTKKEASHAIEILMWLIFKRKKLISKRIKKRKLKDVTLQKELQQQAFDALKKKRSGSFLRRLLMRIGGILGV